jgi:hypothetical protein
LSAFTTSRGALGEPGEVPDVEEQHGDLHLLALERDALFQDPLRHLRVDVGAEGVADALPVAQALDHAIEPRLEQTHLAAVVDRHLDIEIAALHLRHRLAHRHDRVRGGARRQDGGQQPHEQGHAAQPEDRDGQVRPGDVALDYREDGDHEQPEDGHTRAERPREEAAEDHARHQWAVGRIGRQGAGGRGTKNPLGQEVGDGRRRDAAEGHGQSHREDELGGERRVQRGEEGRGRGPQHRRDQADPERAAQHGALLVFVGVALIAEEGARAAERVVSPHRPGHEGDQHVYDGGDEVDENHRSGARDVRRYHPDGEYEDHHCAGGVGNDHGGSEQQPRLAVHGGA